jgi:hypothetical protein
MHGINESLKSDVRGLAPVIAINSRCPALLTTTSAAAAAAGSLGLRLYRLCLQDDGNRTYEFQISIGRP